MRRISTTARAAVAASACWTARRIARRLARPARSGRNPKPVPYLQQSAQRLLAHCGRHFVKAEAGPLVEGGQPLERNALDSELHLGARRELEGSLRGAARQHVARQHPL